MTPPPVAARVALLEMAEQIEMLTAPIETLDRKIVAAVRADETARRLTTIPGVSPIIAATVRAVLQDTAAFRSRRDLAAWVGITPQANSGGGKERIGRISKRGNKQLANTADRWRDVHPEAGAARRAPAFVDHLTDVTSILQGRRRRAGQQDGSDVWALLIKGGAYQAPAIMRRA